MCVCGRECVCFVLATHERIARASLPGTWSDKVDCIGNALAAECNGNSQKDELDKQRLGMFRCLRYPTLHYILFLLLLLFIILRNLY